MSEELKKELGEEIEAAQQEAKVEEAKEEVKAEPPLTGLKLYNAFKKTQPKGMGKQELALQWVAYKVSLGLPIVSPKVKKPRKVPANRLGKKDEVDDVSQMIGDFNIGRPQVVDVSA
jgi:hypothetical protein